MSAPDLSRATWRKSSYSNASGSCVEIAVLKGAIGEHDIAVRDSKDPTAPRSPSPPASGTTSPLPSRSTISPSPSPRLSAGQSEAASLRRQYVSVVGWKPS